MAKELNVIDNLDTACSMLRESFWTEEGKKGTPIMQYFAPELFLDKENVKRMAAAVAVNLRNGYDAIEANEDVSFTEIRNYEKEVNLIKVQFKRGVNYQLQQAYQLNPEKAEKAELKNEIKDKINDFSKGII
jgi:adenine-specific DNA methylase